MNGDLSKEIKTNLDNTTLYNDDKLLKKLTVDVDMSVVKMENRIANGIIKVSLSEFYSIALERLQSVTKLLRVVDLSKPKKQSIMGKIFDIPLDADLSSKTTALYDEMRFVSVYHGYIKTLLKRANDIQDEMNDMIVSGAVNRSSTINITALLAQLEGLKKIKKSLLQLDECFEMITTNPRVRRFMYYWRNYKENGYFPVQTTFNDEAYKFDDCRDELACNDSDVIEEYNDMSRKLRKIRKYSKTFNSFMLYVSMAYGILMATYKRRIANCINCMDDYINRLNNQNAITDEDKSKIVSLGLMKNSFLELKDEIDLLAADRRIHKMGIRSGSEFLKELYSQDDSIKEK